MCEDADRAVCAWSWTIPPTIRTNTDGLINRTFILESAGSPVGVLQQLNTKIFSAEVHEDIDTITQRLTSRSVATPQLMRTREGGLWHTDPGGGVWRCMSHEGDRTIHKVRKPEEARSAGRLVARFHGAVQDLSWSFRSVRAGAHDTRRHMAHVQEALQNHPAHRLYEFVAPLAQDILSRWSDWGQLPVLPRRVIHGDLKISNVRFLGDEAHCLIDLDTMARDTLDVELGDAMRSWCNPASEDAQDTCFDLEVFEAAMEGYASAAHSGEGPSEAEWVSVVPGIERVALELAARFASDALDESYFGWDVRFGSRGDHNLLRARGQLALAASLRAQRREAERVVTRARSTR